MSTADRLGAFRHAFRVVLLTAGFGLVLLGLSAPAAAFEPVPEIDAGSMASAITLLTGGLLILTGRRGTK